ncbi:unnamed protein product [Caenorhabditis auriculariae]|uniref:Protein kinase domain-containing protein n=1 Tax=Caenorhabditis auriculariae TaxID=2777116 RepID=A0A8S1GUF8_9PELO|nr:unnamed protein product [Caenorhabditis auriculariae]
MREYTVDICNMSNGFATTSHTLNELHLSDLSPFVEAIADFTNYNNPIIQYCQSGGILKGITGKQDFKGFLQHIGLGTEIRLFVTRREPTTPEYDDFERFRSFVYSQVGMFANPIGYGAQGRVYSVNIEEKVYAVKMILKRYETDEVDNEVDALQKCRGDHIINLEYSIKENNIYYLFLEYMDRGHLGDLVRRCEGSVPPRVLQQIAWATFQGLRTLWTRGYLHRDMKEDNILLSSDGSVKVSDLGLAKKVDNTSKIACTELGAEGYQSPERVRGQDYGEKADVWAFGIILYRIVVDENVVSRTKDQIIDEQLEVPSSSDVPSDLRQLINNCLQLSEELRWGAAEIADCSYFTGVQFEKALIAEFLAQNPDKQSEMKLALVFLLAVLAINVFAGSHEDSDSSSSSSSESSSGEEDVRLTQKPESPRDPTTSGPANPPPAASNSSCCKGSHSQLDAMCCYNPKRQTYFCCIPAKLIGVFASALTLAMHLIFAICFLVYGNLYGLIPLIATIIAHAIFLAINFGFMARMVRLYVVFEILMSIAMLGVGCWMIVLVFIPDNSFIYQKCVDNLWDDCKSFNRATSASWGGTFILFFIVNIILLQIFKQFSQSLRQGNSRRRNSSCSHPVPLPLHHPQPPPQAAPTQIFVGQQPLQTATVQPQIVYLPAPSAPPMTPVQPRMPAPLYQIPQQETPYPQTTATGSAYPYSTNDAPPAYEKNKY